MKTRSLSSNSQTTSAMTRRGFIAGAGASMLTFSVLKPELARSAEANGKINIGLIGCGGRGRWIADLFQQHGGFQLVAAADYFQDHVDAVGEKFKLPADRRFTGLSGYRKLLGQKLDAVVVQSPPYFHPEQCAAAVEAGRHVYLAKPVAVDVPGCLSIEESGKKATAKQLCFLVDFQTRANELYQDAARRLHAGELGKIALVEASYQCGPTFTERDRLLRENPTNPEARLRAWGVDPVLSGEVIVEQNIHALDVACWLLNAHPLSAYGTGGRARDFVGACLDHYAVVFQFPNDIITSFNSRQYGFAYDDILCRVYGLKGTVDTHYFGKVTFKSTEFSSSGDVGNLYTTGAAANIATFHNNITKGVFGNPTVAESVRSNLTSILGRTAAYQKGAVVTWQEMMRKKEKLAADLKGLKV
jgi:predicted dehydrogenase